MSDTGSVDEIERAGGASEPRGGCPLGNHPMDVAAWLETHGRPDSDELLWRCVPIKRRILAYVGAAIARGGTMPLYELVSRALAAFGKPRCERSVRSYIAAVRASGRFYVFTPNRGRRGRSPVVFIRSRTRISRARISPCNSYYKGAKEGTEKRRPSAGFSRLRRFAFPIARECLERHWDNCKVSPSLRHAWRFVLRWLIAGRMTAEIVAAYDVALHQRHKDATDWGLNHGCADSVRWQPSSTVSLASTILASNLRSMTFRQWLQRRPAE